MGSLYGGINCDMECVEMGEEIVKLKRRIKELEDELTKWKLGTGIVVDEGYFNKLEKYYKKGGE